MKKTTPCSLLKYPVYMHQMHKISQAHGGLYGYVPTPSQ